MARRSIRASLSAIALSLVIFFYTFGLAGNTLCIKVIAFLLAVVHILRIYISKKLLQENSKSEKLWKYFKYSVWSGSVLWSAALVSAFIELNVISPHFVVLFAMIAGIVSISLFTLSLDASLFMPSQVLILCPLAILSIVQYLQQQQNYSLALAIIFLVYFVYQISQFKSLNRQQLKQFQLQLDLENSNQALKSSKEFIQEQSEHREKFITVALTLASKSLPLPVFLEKMTYFIEQYKPGMICSILLLDKEGKHLLLGAAPGLPDFFNEAVSKVVIGESVGSCGTAAYTGESVIVEDIETHPYWDDYRDLAKRAGLRSCWSEPIKDSSGKTLGTFALYQHFPNSPTQRDREFIQQSAHLVAIVLQKYNSEKEQELIRNQLALIYNNAVDSMWLISVEGKNQFRFESVNDAFVAVTGLRKEQTLGKLMEDVLPSSSHELVRAKYNEAINSQKPIEYLEVAHLPSGVKIGQIRMIPIKDEKNQVNKLLGIAEDITHRKQLEINLQEALKSRDEFLLVASHELKTPLTTLQLLIHNIFRFTKNGETTIPVDVLLPKLEMARTQSERIGQLVNNLLDVAQLHTDKRELKLQLKENVNLSKLIEDITTKYTEEYLKTGSALTKRIEANIIGVFDPIRIEQVIINLLSNALKYGAGKPVELMLRSINDKAYIEVLDKGIGIPKDKQSKIFERFERAVQEHSYKGLGLGLWIVQQIVESHEGKIWVESEEGKGSLFVVELPLKKSIGTIDGK